LVRGDLTALTITTSLSYFLRRSAFLAKGQDEVDIFLMIARVKRVETDLQRAKNTCSGYPKAIR
jgi:hypothetical protein